mgnify:CR=1 FL=1
MAQHSIEILTDSTCDIPEALIQQYQIKVLPHYIIWGEKQFRDRIDLQAEAFYQRLVKDPVYPSSAHVTEEEYRQAFLAAKNNGAQEIITITISSAMSGAYQAAMNAAKTVDLPIHILDGKGPTMTLGWQVLKAARLRDVGEPVSRILEEVDLVRKKMVQYVSMNSMEYLYKGGRIGNATRLIGSLLDIKPLVYIDHATGLVEASGVTRTFKKAVGTLYDKFFKSLSSHKNLRIAVLHGNLLGEAEKLADRITKEFSPQELIINMTGPVLGINTGPGALALCGYPDE